MCWGLAGTLGTQGIVASRGVGGCFGGVGASGCIGAHRDSHYSMARRGIGASRGISEFLGM